MPLDDGQKQKAKQYFDQHFKCMNCQKTDGYEVDLGHVPLEKPKAGGLIRVPKMLPILIVGCAGCGFVQFYSAKVGGIVA